MRTDRLSSLKTAIFSPLYPQDNPHLAKNDPTVSRIAAKWVQGDPKGKKRVDDLLAHAGLFHGRCRFAIAIRDICQT